MRGAVGTLVGGTLLALSASVLTVPDATAVEAPPEHRVYIAYLAGSTYNTTPEQMTEGVSAALDAWRAMAPTALASLETVGDPVPVALTSGQVGCEADPYIPAHVESKYDVVKPLVGMGSPPPGVVEHLVLFVPFECLFTAPGGATYGVSIASGGAITAVDGVQPNSAKNLEDGLVRSFAHNFGIGDAGVGCPPGVRSCASVGNGDCYGPTGSGSRRVLSTAQRAVSGIIEPGEMVSVTGAPADEVVTLGQREGTSGVRGASVYDPVTGATYYLDYQVVSDEPLDAGDQPCPDGVVVSKVLEWRHETRIVPRVAAQPPSPFHDHLAWVAGDVIELSGAVRLEVLSIDQFEGARVRVVTTPVPPFEELGRVEMVGPIAEGLMARPVVVGMSPEPEWVQHRWYVDGAPLKGFLGDPVETPILFPVPKGATTLTSEITAYHSQRGYAVVRETVHVTPMPLRLRQHPVLKGRLKAGKRVRATFRHEPPGVDRFRVTSKWYVDGRLVAKRDGRSLRLRGRWAGERIVVVLKVTGPERTRLVRRSRPSRPIKG